MSYHWKGWSTLDDEGNYYPIFPPICQGDNNIPGRYKIPIEGKVYPCVDSIKEAGYGYMEYGKKEGELKSLYYPVIDLEVECYYKRGNDCDACENILWADNATPYMAKVTFSGLNHCDGKPEPPGLIWYLTQYENTCWYQYYSDTWWCRWGALSGLNSSFLFLYYLESGQWRIYFYDLKQPKCQTSFTNDEQSDGICYFGSNWYGYGGTATVEYSDIFLL